VNSVQFVAFCASRFQRFPPSSPIIEWSSPDRSPWKNKKLLSLRNDVGLLSEEYDPESRRLLGNFPQAFSHVGLIDIARNLSRRGGSAEDRGL
jgi:hypothetical protein